MGDWQCEEDTTARDGHLGRHHVCASPNEVALCSAVQPPSQMADHARPSSSTTIVLRKRKRPNSPLVLRLSASPAPSLAASRSLSPPGTSTNTPPARKRYTCDFAGCTKAYSKPARLAEHQRSHTGDVCQSSSSVLLLLMLLQRPFVCQACSKSYLRETHLQAHSRSHLPDSARPFSCEDAECGKRFWTSQHLRAHENLHKGEKPFKARLIPSACRNGSHNCVHSAMNRPVMRLSPSSINCESTSA